MTQIYLHAGLPRTATTALQKDVFPPLKTICYIGKPFHNRGMQNGPFKPIQVVREACNRHLSGDSSGLRDLGVMQATLLLAIKRSLRDNLETASFIELWCSCAELAAGMLGQPVLYSDESLAESASGLEGVLKYGDGVPLERLHESGFLDKVSLSVVLRDPLEFLTASYYKAMEHRHRLRWPASSFRDYMELQEVIYKRSPSASRIFLCLHRSASAHFKRLNPNAVITLFSDLVASDHVVDTLLGFRTGEAPVSLSSLPRENQSWRKSEANDFVLSAPGVPAGLSIEAYAQTFAETLDRMGLDSLCASEALDSSKPSGHSQAKNVDHL